MIDITHKSNTLRIATAQAIVRVGSNATIEKIINKQIPKGDVLEMARTAGLFAAKKTPELIPDCHPMPIEGTKISYEIAELEVKIFVEVKTIYKTGVEVEAMHAASVVALTIYDMLKPVDKSIEICSIRLLEKSGGKSGKKDHFEQPLAAAVLVCSDSVSAGKKEDRAGKMIVGKLEALPTVLKCYDIIPDMVSEIQEMVRQYIEQGIELVLITGGTGLSPTDVTFEALQPLIERPVPGLGETMRNYGQQRTPLAMLSRSIGGFIGQTLVIALPGSTKGAEESMDAIFPAALHLFKMVHGGKH